MKANTVNIEELGLERNKSKELILNLLNQQIAYYKLQHLTAWEKNHSLSDTTTNEKISALQRKKEEIEGFFNECSTANEMDITISVDVRVKQEVMETAYA